MFHSLARNATATDSPVKINGVARLSVSRAANLLPTAPFTISPSVAKGSAPANIANAEPITTVTASATAGKPRRRTRPGLAMGSSRIGHLEPLTGHPAAQLHRTHFAAAKSRRQPTFRYHMNNVCQAHDFIQIL